MKESSRVKGYQEVPGKLLKVRDGRRTLIKLRVLAVSSSVKVVA